MKNSKVKKILIISFLAIMCIIFASYYNSYMMAGNYIHSFVPELEYVNSDPFYGKLPTNDTNYLGWLFRFSKKKDDSEYFHNIEIYTSFFGTIVGTNPIDLEARLKNKNQE